MRYRVVFIVGLAVGYVLGTRAGRERYEQIKRLAQRVADNPKVQEAAGLVGARASQVASKAKDRVGEKMPFIPSARSDNSAGGGPGNGLTPTARVGTPTTERGGSTL
ncbi:YtxH domain-containing protein [Thermopolyspora sp. NPDC052614]|uniref:YtxH domain-containing protein n=1 Tax=Thermopolyspora sp. NPDC052614 TaxID=3155682 RepID=UPI00344897B6